MEFLKQAQGTGFVLSSTTYDHPSGMFSLSLPEEWVGNVSYVEMEDSAAFYTEADFELLISIHPQPTSWVEANLSENIISLSSFDTNGVPHQYILEYSLSEAAPRQDEELFQSLLAQVDQIGFRSSVTPELIDQLVHDSYESDMAAAIAYLPYLSWSSYRDTCGEGDMFSLLSALREYAGSGQADWGQYHTTFSPSPWTAPSTGPTPPPTRTSCGPCTTATPNTSPGCWAATISPTPSGTTRCTGCGAPLAWADGREEPLSDNAVRQRLGAAHGCRDL